MTINTVIENQILNHNTVNGKTNSEMYRTANRVCYDTFWFSERGLATKGNPFTKANNYTVAYLDNAESGEIDNWVKIDNTWYYVTKEQLTNLFDPYYEETDGEFDDLKEYANSSFAELNRKLCNVGMTYDEYQEERMNILNTMAIRLISMKEITWPMLEYFLITIESHMTCSFMAFITRHAYARMTKEAFTKGVMYAATMKEMFCREMIPLFKKKKFDKSLYNDTKSKLPKELVLYRGCGEDEVKKGKYGFSWTTDRNVAEWFAKRTAKMNNINTVICTCKANVDDIIAYVNNRNEKECIFLQPKDVKVCEEMKINA